MASVKTNIDFVNKLLATKGLSGRQRFNILTLFKLEMINYDETLKAQVKELLASKNDSGRKISGGMIETEKQLHDPLKIVRFLKRFTNKNDFMRWSVHRWDRTVASSYKEFIEIIDKQKIEGQSNKQIVYELQKYNKELGFLLHAFLFQDQEHTRKDKKIEYKWGQKKVTIGWRFPKNLIENWCDVEGKLTVEGKSPFEMRFEKDIAPIIIEEKSGKVIKTSLPTFDAVVNTFKKEIQFRSNSFFKMVKTNIDRLKEELDADFFPEESFIKGLFESNHHFYTYTSAVEIAWEIIHSMIKERQLEIEKQSKDKEYVGSLSYDSKLEDIDGVKYRVIRIIHNQSFPTSSIDSSDKISGQEGDMATLKKNLQSIAHFSIESDFPLNDGSNKRKPLRVKYLDSGELSEIKEYCRPNVEEIQKMVNGFHYILKFPN
jgi:hypothetical protein